jgi:hypothetical protein
VKKITGEIGKRLLDDDMKVTALLLSKQAARMDFAARIGMGRNRT